MNPVSTLAAAEFHTDAAAAQEPSRGRLAAAVVGLIEAIRRGAADRRLRDTLADMDDAMLRDIGIADDEMYRVRARERFTPRAWTVSRETGSRMTRIA